MSAFRIIIAIGAVALMFIGTKVFAQSNPKWPQCTVKDTVNVPIDAVWALLANTSFKSIISKEYADIPVPISSEAVEGNFTQIGDRRLMHFYPKGTALETIIKIDPPYLLGYEMTEMTIPIKSCSNYVVGYFALRDLGNGKTEVAWSHSFKPKNFLAKRIIKTMTKSSFKDWSEDYLDALGRYFEQEYPKW